MIVFGGNNFNQYLYEDSLLDTPMWYTLNFYSLLDIGLNISQACPAYETIQSYMHGMISRETLDREYARYLFENPTAFVSFMEIMMGEYYSVDVFVHYDDTNPMVSEFVETLIAIIRERYHKLCSIVNEVYDLHWVEDSMMDAYGNQVFDMDRLRYIQLKGLGNDMG